LHGTIGPTKSQRPPYLNGMSSYFGRRAQIRIRRRD
jgi:hypothetical protein